MNAKSRRSPLNRTVLAATMAIIAGCITTVVCWQWKNRESKLQLQRQNDASDAESSLAEHYRPTTFGITNTLDWTMVESSDYPEYVQNLRKVRCPERTIQDIVIADVNALYKSRALKGLAEKNLRNIFAYWVKYPTAETNREPLIVFLQGIETERQQTLTSLLGPSWSDVSGFSIVKAFATPVEELALAFLSPEKRKLIESLENENKAIRKKRFVPGVLRPEDIQELRRIRAELLKNVKAVLTPEECLQYELNSSETADLMRNRLEWFRPTEAEFRKIYAVQRNFDDSFGYEYDATTTSDANQVLAKTEAEARMKEELKSILGDQRFGEYERAKDFDYDALQRYGFRSQLGEDSVNNLYDLKRQIEMRALDIKNQDVSAGAKEVQLQMLRDEALASIRNQLGDGLSDGYLQDPGGSSRWLKRITEVDRLEGARRSYQRAFVAE